MNRPVRTTRYVARTVGIVAALGALLAAGCDDDDSEEYYYDDAAYADGYDYYYPADIAYSDAYYADDLDGFDDDFILEDSRLKQNVGSTRPGSVLRDLASGVAVCPGQVTVTKQGSAAACRVSGYSVPASTTIVFQTCQLKDGGQLDGSLRIDTTQTAKDANCDSATHIDIEYTSTATNLSYTTPTGARVVVPSLTLTGVYTRTLGSAPASINLTVEGEITRFDENGAGGLQRTLSGTQTLVPLGRGSGYRLEGTLTMSDAAGLQAATASSDGLTRSEDCCYPTSGSLEVDSMDLTSQWTFGPSCGAASLNGTPVSLSECL